MKIIVRIITILLMMANGLPGQCGQPIVMTVGKEKVRLGEFLYLYKKNRIYQPADQTIEEYAQMFADYKLKVLDALDHGINNTESFRLEYDHYRKMLADSLLYDRPTVDSLMHAAYAHYLENLDLGDIFLPSGAGIALAESIADEARAKGNFAELARKYSEEIASAGAGGRIGWIRAGEYPYVVEDAAYMLTEGEVSRPIVTDEGFHIVKLYGRRRDEGRVKVSHILKVTSGLDENQKKSKRTELDSIRGLIADGADFHQLASKLTDDPSGHGKGGRLPAFGRGIMVPEFEEVALGLSDGEVSEIIETPYGFHLIYCDESLREPSFQDLRADIERSLKTDLRDTVARQVYLTSFAKTHGLKGKTYGELYEAALEALYQENEDYRYLLDEYRDGMLLFGISNHRLWRDREDNEEQLNDYFESHRDSYVWGDLHYKGYLVMAENDTLASNASDWLERLPILPEWDVLSREALKRFGKKVRIEKVLAAKGYNPIIDYIAFGAQRPEAIGRWKAFKGARGRVIDRPEEMNDVRASVANDWQLSAENDWLKELRSRYQVKINNNVLMKAVQKALVEP